jgi:hypothetical protein
MKQIAIGVLFVASLAHAATAENSCLAKKCSAGDKAITYASKQDPYYACPTRELASYTNFVLGLVAAQYEFTGTLPNISDKTGEPEYVDQGGKPNETRLMLDSLRGSAKVQSFDQAVAMCKQGGSKIPVTIMNAPSDEIVVWVRDERHSQSFWMPKSSLDKR